MQQSSWKNGLLVAASLLGCQAVAATGLIASSVVVLLGQGPGLDSAGSASFLKGFQVGEATVRDCGGEWPSIQWRGMSADVNPNRLLAADTRLSLVVAPPAADLRAFSDLAERRNLTVVLPYQRGESLTLLAALESRDRLWPLVAPFDDELTAIAEATFKQGWRRVMVVQDSSDLEAASPQPFVEAFERLGGKVVSFEQESIQRVDPDNDLAVKRLQTDLAYAGASAMVLAADPKGRLATTMAATQLGGPGGAKRRPAWVWLVPEQQARTVKPKPWQQLIIDKASHGSGWQGFATMFEQRWGKAPDLVAAAGFDTARLVALSTIAPPPISSEGRLDSLGWLDPGAEVVPICTAISLRKQGESVRPEAAASDFALRSGQAPSGEAEVRLLSAS